MQSSKTAVFFTRPSGQFNFPVSVPHVRKSTCAREFVYTRFKHSKINKKVIFF